LTRAEFERRHDAMPDLKKAELIEGVVHMPSPVRAQAHSRPHFTVIGWLGDYERGTPGIEGYVNASIRLDMRNEPQPDALLRILPEFGGRSKIDADDYLVGGPELALELSASTIRFDLDEKFEAYQRNGVREYVVWRVSQNQVSWFVLGEDRFEPLAPSSQAYLRSEAFPGLWLDPAALIRGDLKTLHEVLHQGLASPEHAAFVNRLAANAARKP
jgi:Uma2 family endonuclease